MREKKLYRSEHALSAYAVVIFLSSVSVWLLALNSTFSMKYPLVEIQGLSKFSSTARNCTNGPYIWVRGVHAEGIGATLNARGRPCGDGVTRPGTQTDHQTAGLGVRGHVGGPGGALTLGSKFDIVDGRTSGDIPRASSTSMDHQTCIG